MKSKIKLFSILAVLIFIGTAAFSVSEKKNTKRSAVSTHCNAGTIGICGPSSFGSGSACYQIPAGVIGDCGSTSLDPPPPPPPTGPPIYIVAN